MVATDTIIASCHDFTRTKTDFVRNKEKLITTEPKACVVFCRCEAQYTPMGITCLSLWHNEVKTWATNFTH